MSKKTISLSLDTEWFGETGFLTCQILLKNTQGMEKMYIYYEKDYEELFRNKLPLYLKDFGNRFPENTPFPTFIPWKLSEKNFIFEDVINRYKYEFDDESCRKIQINYFFAIRDLYILFSTSFIEKLFTESFEEKKDFITRKNATFGRFKFQDCVITLQDYSGLATKYEGLLEILDIKHPVKNSLKKDRMNEELKEEEGRLEPVLGA